MRGIEADRARLHEVVERNTALATALAPTLGYEVAARVAQRAVAQDLTVRQAALAEGVLDAETWTGCSTSRRLATARAPRRGWVRRAATVAAARQAVRMALSAWYEWSREPCRLPPPPGDR